MTALPVLVALSLASAVAQPAVRWEDAHLRAAEDYLRRNDARTASAILQNVVEADPSCRVEIYWKLAGIESDLGDAKQAAATFERGLAAHPRSPELTKRFTALLMRQEPLSPRIGELLAATAAQSARDAEAHYLYGEWACANNRKELCVSELTIAAALPASGPQAQMQIFTLIGVAEDDLNQPRKAEAAFRKALDFNLALPRPSPDSLLEYIRFLMKESREEEAQPLLARLLKLAPTCGPAYLERAKYLSNQPSQMEKAAEQGELALKYAANDKAQERAAHIFLAKTYHALGRADAATSHEAMLEK